MPSASSSSPRALGIGIVTLVLAIAFEGMAIGTAMPAAAEDLGKLSLYAWAFTLFTLGMVISTVIGGRLCDRLGPIPPFVVSYLVFAIGLVAGGLATSMEMLIGARFVQGFGAGAMNLALTVVVAHAFTPEQQSRMMSWVSAAWVVPSFIGPPVAAWLTRVLSWHWVFFAILPIMAVAALLAGRSLLDVHRTHRPDPHHDEDEAPLWSGLVLAASVALIQFGGQRLTWWSAAFAAAGLVLLVLGLRTFMPAGFFRFAPGIPSTAWTRALLSGAFFAAVSFLPLMLVQVRGLSLFWAGMVISAGSVGWTLGSFLQSRRWLKLRRDQIVTLGTLSSVVGLGSALAMTVLPGLPVLAGAAGWVFAGLGMGFGMSSTALVVMTLSPSAKQGRNMSALQASETLGISLFTAVAGTIFANLLGRVSQQFTFGAVIASALVVGALAVATSLRVGPVENAVTAQR